MASWISKKKWLNKPVEPKKGLFLQKWQFYTKCVLIYLFIERFPYSLKYDIQSNPIHDCVFFYFSFLFYVTARLQKSKIKYLRYLFQDLLWVSLLLLVSVSIITLSHDCITVIYTIISNIVNKTNGRTVSRIFF